MLVTKEPTGLLEGYSVEATETFSYSALVATEEEADVVGVKMEATLLRVTPPVVRWWHKLKCKVGGHNTIRFVSKTDDKIYRLCLRCAKLEEV
ncbi:MAG: hypothetical protein GY941_22270 [Planctomycetes bacterium]|nr:hypothetical protein [Planctomycetota bacterium]